MVSVVIPLYNKEKYIQKTLKSVLKQTFQDFEIVIVDDGSTDNSLAEVKKINDKRIKIISQKNEGVSAARNRGILEAKHNLIAFLDADDEWLPNYLETIYFLVNKYPECDVFATQYILKSQHSSVLIHTQGLAFNTDGVINDYFHIASINMPPLWTSAIVVRKKAMNAICGFPLGITSGEDLLTWARLASIYQIAFSTQHLSIYNNTPVKWNEGRPTDPQDIVGAELKKILAIINKGQINSLKAYIGLWHKMRAISFIRKNQKLLALKEIFISLYYNPWNIKVYLFVPLALMPISVLKYIFEEKSL